MVKIIAVCCAGRHTEIQTTATSVIPGFGLSIGVTLSMLSLIKCFVLISCWSLDLSGVMKSGFTVMDFATITRRRVLMSFAVSLKRRCWRRSTIW